MSYFGETAVVLMFHSHVTFTVIHIHCNTVCQLTTHSFVLPELVLLHCSLHHHRCLYITFIVSLHAFEESLERNLQHACLCMTEASVHNLYDRSGPLTNGKQ